MTMEEFIERSEANTVLTPDWRYAFQFQSRKVKHKGHVPYYVVVDYDMPEDYEDPKFDTIEEAFAFRLADGRTVGEIIESWSDVPTLMLDAPPVFHYKSAPQ